MSNPVIESLLNHRSVRKYLPKPVEPETVELILKAGTRAATGGNLQLYTFVVIDDPAKKEALDNAGLYTDFRYADVPLIVIALVDVHRTRRWFEVAGVPSDDICDNLIHKFLLAEWDALIALQNVVVAAESLGLGTCYDSAGLLIDAQELLGAPEHVFPAGMICVGYPDTSPELSSRLPLEAVVHRNNYRVFDDEEIREIYRDREKVWEKLPAALKGKLQAKGINNIPQGLAARKFRADDYFISDEKGYSWGVARASRIVSRNLKKAGFDLSCDD